MRVAVLFSGRGSNFKSIVDFSKNSNYKVVCSITDNHFARGVKLSCEAGVPCIALPLKGLYKNRTEEWEDLITDLLVRFEVELVVLAGFMRILHSKFCNTWRGRCINIHPSLLPKYPGMYTHARVLEAKDDIHGCSIHYVTAEVDGGPLIAQSVLEVNHFLHPDELASEVLVLENNLYPRVIDAISQNRLFCVLTDDVATDYVLFDGVPLTQDIDFPSIGNKLLELQ